MKRATNKNRWKFVEGPLITVNGEKGRYVTFGGRRWWSRDSSIRPRKITPKERAWLIQGLEAIS
jgi:hypothetical protein